MTLKISSRLQRAVLPTYQKAARKVHDLEYLFIELTQDCNIQCLHCGSDCTKDSKTPPLSKDAILKVLTQIRDKYKPRHHNISLALTGGEPLCYPGLFDLGRKIKELEFPWGLVTNGFAWTKKKVLAAQDAGLCSITISLDGFEEDHDWLRGRQGSFQKAVETIRMFVGHRFWQGMDVVTCVNKRNLQKLDSFHQHLLTLHVPAWRLFIISPIGRAAKVPELFLDPSEFQELLQKIKRYRDSANLPVTLSESGYLGPRHERTVRDHHYFCKAGINVAGIMANGDILACPNIDRRFCQGNIHQDSFVQVWEEKYQPFRDRSWMKQGQCQHCKEWKYCQGNSFHLWDRDQQCTRLCHFKNFDL